MPSMAMPRHRLFDQAGVFEVGDESFDEFDHGIWTPNIDLNFFGQKFRGLLSSIAPDLGGWMNGLRQPVF